MAITHIEYSFVRRMAKQGLFAQNPKILELGQSNWYGDVSLDKLLNDIGLFVADQERAEALKVKAVGLAQAQEQHWLFGLGDVFWETFLGPHTYHAIDLDGVDERALKYDLNEPVPLEESFDVVCNFGTAEHVFNVYQVFKTVHDLTKTGGWMLHGLPFQGWIDHGFYNVQPTLFFDLVAANGYGKGAFLYAEISPPNIVQIDGRETVHALAEQGKIGANAMLFAALRKLEDSPFKAPMQGYYGRRLDAKAVQRWESLR